MEDFDIREIDRDMLTDRMDELRAAHSYGDEWDSLSFARDMLYLIDEGLLMEVEEGRWMAHDFISEAA